MRVDVHQHMWTEPLVDALAAREALPFVRTSGGVTTLHCRAEQPYVIEDPRTAPERHAQLIREDGLDLALIAISSPIGIEALPRDSAGSLIEAHLTGVLALGEQFGAWGPVALHRPDPDDVDDLLARGCAGISLPAGALAGPNALFELGPVLERVAAHGAPLFVHPGPAPGQIRPEAYLDEPLWWRALTDYVAQMQAAWLTFAAVGRREHPDLVVVFAMLAGVAPLLAERLAARGGPAVDLRDPQVFYDTSSYGAAAVQPMAQRVGLEQLVYGSDRPVVEPVRTGQETLFQANAGRLFAHVGAAAS